MKHVATDNFDHNNNNEAKENLKKKNYDEDFLSRF